MSRTQIPGIGKCLLLQRFARIIGDVHLKIIALAFFRAIEIGCGANRTIVVRARLPVGNDHPSSENSSCPRAFTASPLRFHLK